VKVNKPGNSEIYSVLTDPWGGIMPPSPHSPLTERQRSLINAWILQGAKNNNCDTNTVDPPIVNDSICYSRDIAPILFSSCALSNCHDAATASEDIILDSYQALMSSGEDEPIVVAGNYQASKIYQVFLLSDPEERMPPSPRLPLETYQIALFKKWITEGAKNSYCDAGPCDTTLSHLTYNQAIGKIIQNSCRGCHSGSNPQMGIRLEHFTNLKSVATNGLL